VRVVMLYLLLSIYDVSDPTIRHLDITMILQTEFKVKYFG
jgi:hypothetical protein